MKKSKYLVIGIIAAVLVLAAVLGLVFTQCGSQESADSNTETTAPAEKEAVKLYWNIDRTDYAGKSEAGMSSRAPEEDGYFHIRFHLDGEIVTLRAEERKVVNAIDHEDLMGLEINEEGIITRVVRLEELPVERVGWQFYVQSAARNIIKLNSSINFNGMEVLLEDLDPNRVWDMTGKSGPKGCVAEAIKYDKVVAIADMEGNITHVFICDRSNYMLTHEGECEHCQQTVTWSEWTREDALPKDTGHYQLQVDVKTKSQTSINEDAKVCLDLNGHRIDGGKDSRLIIMNKPSIELAIMDTSEEQTGVIAPHGMGNMGMGIMVKYGALYLHGGTIDASDVVNTSGSAVSVSKGQFFFMYGGKIIGGEARGVQNPTTGAYESGAGGAVYVSGKFVMDDGTIENGKATSVISYKNGTKTYNRGLGGNVYLASGSEFEMNGGTIKNGQAGSYGGNIACDGTSTLVINGGTVSGGYVSGDGRMGGNIYGSSRVCLTINGGSILNGKTRGHSGNIYSSGSLNINGGAIRGGVAYDAATGKLKDTATHHNIFAVNATVRIWGGTIQGGFSITDTSDTDAKTATLYLNGSPRITDGPNGYDLTISNSRVVVNVGNLGGGAKIGVNAKHGIFTKPTNEGNVDNFYSNIEQAEVLYYEECLGLGRLNCVCGKETHALGCDGKTLLWIPHATGNDLPITTGNYYLTKDVVTSKGYVVSAGEDVKLDFNGHNITYKVSSGTTSGFRTYRSDNNSKMTLTDTTDAPGTMQIRMPAAGTKYTGKPLLKSEGVYFEAGSAEEQAEAERLWAQADYGALLWARGGEINIINGIFDGTNVTGTREQGGMVIYVANSTSTDATTGVSTTYQATMNIYGGLIKGGNVAAPGNIAVKENAVLNMYGGTIQGGKANKGGALYVSGKVTIYGGTIQGGTSVTPTGTAADGGNIYVSLTGDLKIQGGTITGGKADIGGNLFSYGATEITGGVIEKGEATKCGGNVGTNSAKSSITIGGNAIIRDGYGLRGGNVALYVRGNADFTIGGDAQILNGEGKESGGNIFVNTWLDDASNLVMTGGTVSGGKAPVGGNVYVGGSATASNATFTATGGTIEKGECTNGANIALGHASATATLAGVTVHNNKEGAYNISAENGTLNIGEGTNITNEAANVTNIRGSATADTVTNIVMTGGTISGGTNSNVSLYTQDSITVSGGTISGGKASEGGNIKINSGAALVVTGGTVTGGEATSTGGNIYVSNGTVSVTGGTVEKGKATTAGGNIGTNQAGSEITIGGEAVIRDGESNRGGNVAVHSHANNGLTISGNASITGGKAKTTGGNLSLYMGAAATKPGTVVMTGGTISGGEAPNGGNVNLKGKDATNTATFILAGGTVENGIATGEGANIYTENGFTAMELSGTVNGAVYPNGAKVTLKGEPVIDKTGTEYTYSIKLPAGVAMDVAELTGGKVYVTAEIGAVVAENAASEALTANVISEVTEDGALVDVIWKEEAKVLLLGELVDTYCTCGASKALTYECHCAAADAGNLEWKPWYGTDTLPTTTGNYYLEKDVDLTAETVAKAENNATIRIDLRGKKIILENAEDIYNFTDVTGVRLVITDSTAKPGSVVLTGTDTVTGGILKLTSGNTFVLYRATLDVSGFQVGELDGGLAYINTGATFKVYSGALVGNAAGRMLHVNGTANLYGGTLSGAKVNIRTNTDNAKVLLQGVTITNTVAGATSVRVDRGELTIANGTTITNTATGATNVITTNSNVSSIIMTGGTISGGTNSNVRLMNGDSFRMSGGIITGGTAANGGNIYVEGTTGAESVLTITGGTIENGTTTGTRTGANIRLNNGASHLVVDGATIPGGVHANANATVTLKNEANIAKAENGSAYSLLMGSTARLHIGEMTGGRVYVTSAVGRIVAENVTTDMSGCILSEVATEEIVWNETDKTLVVEAFVTEYCSCGATKRGAYECHCADADKANVTWQAWEGTDALPTAAGNYYLKNDVELTAETVAKAENNATIRIDLRGKKIILENEENLYDFTDVTGVRLVITDSTTKPGAVVLTGTATTLGGILDLTANNTFVLYRATLDTTGLNASSKGGSIISVNSGATFLMGSGDVLGKTGSMIYVKGQANLLGGTVSGASIKVRVDDDNAVVTLAGVTIPNDVANATSVRVDKGQLTIAAGTAISNTATGASNVVTTNSGVSRIIMTGGTISGGTNSNVRVMNGDTFTMSGGSIRDGSSNRGGNIYVEGTSSAEAFVIISGGTISGGTTTETRTGANIRLNNGSSHLVVDGATIPGGIHANASSTITLKGNVTVNKGDASCDYSIRLGSTAKLIVGEMTGGQVYVYCDTDNKVIAENVTTDLSGYFYSDTTGYSVVYTGTSLKTVKN